MIEKVRIQGYRRFGDLTFKPNKNKNVLVGDNESGKSTIVEAICLALTGRINGRSAQEELNPYWFNAKQVAEFFTKRKNGEKPALPTISIELFFADIDEYAIFHGANNSEVPTRACPGLRLLVEPNIAEYKDEIENHLSSDTNLLPVEYYNVSWRSFRDQILTVKPKQLSVAVIDSRTIRSASGIDYHMRQMLNDHLDPEDRTSISLGFRSAKEEMGKKHFKDVNEKLKTLEGSLNGDALSLAMDQSSRTSWDVSVSPHVADLPLSLSGQGEQAAIKISLAMRGKAGSSKVIIIEEPENHLSHTSMNKLMNQVEKLANPNQQLFVTTHSSFVTNRLGLDSLLLVSESDVAKLTDVPADTVRYFQKLSGYDTLRLVLAKASLLVEGPSDEILVERFYKDKYGHRPIESGIEILSMRGLSFRRSLELAKILKKKCAAIRDADKKTPDELKAKLSDVLENGEREMFVGDPSKGKTLEPQVVNANSPEVLSKALSVAKGTNIEAWMTGNKTEAAIRLAETSETINAPNYISEAIEFVHANK